jgi:excisionase family DNA binding protein
MTKQAELMTVREAALELGCTIPYIYLLLHAKRIDGEQKHGCWLIPTGAVKGYKASHPRIGSAAKRVAQAVHV